MSGNSPDAQSIAMWSPSDNDPGVPTIDTGPDYPLVPAVVKAAGIIRHLNDRQIDGSSLAEISKALGITRSHYQNLLRPLLHSRWVKYESGSRVYQFTSSLRPAPSSGFLSRPLL